MIQDELLWAAAWLNKATGDKKYLQYIVDNDSKFEGSSKYKPLFSWDDKRPGANVLFTTVRREVLKYVNLRWVNVS